MSFYAPQFKELVRRTLELFDHGLASLAAVNLLLGTAAAESRFGHYLRQLNHGPARSAFQIEPKTFGWLQDEYKLRYPELSKRKFEEIEWDLRLAIIMARLRYRIVPEALPEKDDVHAMAVYWKRHYNTYHGAGTVDGFKRAYARYVDGKSG